MDESAESSRHVPLAEIVPGARRTHQRTFTPEEVRAFGELSGDLGVHHLVADANGRVMVQGLLVASIPTRTGGEMNFIARELVFEFLKPVWTGDTIRCESVVKNTSPEENRLRVEVDFVCTNQDGVVVMRGHGRGIVRTAT